MERDRLRVLVPGLASVGLLVAAGFVLDWFSFSIGGLGDLAPSSSVGISLSSMHGCAGDGCQSLSLSRFGGVFPSLCHATLFATGALAAIVALQVGARIVLGEARARITRIGYWVAMFDILLILLTAYVFDPALPAGASQGAEVFGVSFEIARSWAPTLAIAGTLVGLFALHATVERDRELTLPPLGVIVRTTTLPRPPTAPPPVVPDEPKPHPAVNYAVASAELSRAGIDAHREDGSARLVLWRDVVGVVVRRLPEELGGALFVDVVSLADATLRVLPWSRLAGDPIATSSDDPDVHARALVAYVREHVPAIKLDPLTRAFVERTDRPAQLPDASVLAEHDARFA